MAWKLPERSLFAILLRSQWWASALAAVAAFGLVRLFMPWPYAVFATTPFLIILGIVAWKSVSTPRGARLERKLEAIRALSWDAFARALEDSWRREGYELRRAAGAADFELEKSGKVSLVAARRWKAARTGPEPVKELAAEAEKRSAEALLVDAGGLTRQARALAKEKGVRLVEGAELARRVPAGRK